MANALIYDPTTFNRVTDYLVSIHTPDYSGNSNTIIDPNISAVSGVNQLFWKWSGTGDVIVEMNQTEKDTVTELVTNNVGLYSPYVFESLNTMIIPENSIVTVKINGCYFSPYNVPTVDNITVTNTHFVCNDEIEMILDTNGTSLGVKNVYLDGNLIGTLEVIANTWTDFRTGGVTMDSGQYELIGGVLAGDIVRDANGIGINTGSGWARALGLPEFSIPANTTTGCQVILYLPSAGAGMYGLFGDGHGVDTTMYDEMHAGGYITSPTNWWGFFAYASSASAQNIAAYDRIKMKFPTTLTPGSDFEVWGLATGEAFSGGTLIYSGVMPSGVQDTSTNVYPCLIPNNGITMRLQAFNNLGSV